MKHQRFFGTALKGKYKQIRGEEIVSNRFFANENLQAINPKQLIHLHGMEFEYVLQGQGFNNASPLKQPKNTNIRKNVEILNQPKTRTIHSPYQADQLLSPLIRIRRCSVEKESTKQRTQEPNYSHNQQRKRAFSFADERVISPKRRRANTQFRNLYNNSENQANQDTVSNCYMRNQQSQLSQQPSPKLLVPTEFQKKRLNQNRQFTELLQRNHNLVQQLDHQSQRSCDMQIEKLRSNASFKSLRLQEQNSPKVNYSPIDVIKLKDILNAPSANRLELFEKKSDRQTSERGISKKTNTLLRDIMTNQQTKPKMPFQKLEKTIFEEEKQFKVPTMGYVNENTSIETPRFFEEK